MRVRGKLRTSHLVIVGGILALFLAAGWFDQPRPVLESLQQSFIQLGLKNKDFPNQIFHDEMDQLLAESDNDAFFSEALAWSGNGILGTAFEGIRDDREFSASRSLVPTEKTRLLEPVPELKNAAQGLGFVNIFPDSDGTIRRVRLVNKDHISLALAGAAHYLDTVVQATDGRVVLTPGLPSAPHSERRLATDGHGNVRLNFYGQHTVRAALLWLLGDFFL